MSKPILDPNFWSERLRSCSPEQRYQAVYRCPPGEWDKIAKRHTQILADKIQPGDSILDAGCGWGRLLDLLPESPSYYLGIDLSPDFIALARLERSNDDTMFIAGNLEEVLISLPDKRFNWAVCISMRKMIQSNVGEEFWDKIEKELMRVAERVLILEYSDDNYTKSFVLEEGSES